MQMILMLVCGHVLAVSAGFQKPLQFLLRGLLKLPHPAVGLVFVSAMMSWFHWGFGLVAGGLLAGQLAQKKPAGRLAYAAAAYAGFIVWHGGWSGSAPLVVATSGHPWEAAMGVIPIQNTLFSALNLTLLVSVTCAAAFTVFFLPQRDVDPVNTVPPTPPTPPTVTAPGRDYVFWVGLLLAILSVTAFVTGWQTLNLNSLILLLFALALCAQGQQEAFQQAVADGLKGTAGILIQFPLYGAIMAVMRDSGLAVLCAEQMLSVATPNSFLPFVFWGAGALNLVVPSGGGQWAVQAPVIVPVAQKLGVSLPSTVIAFSWGDAWTNLVQPFWALPLLAMTGVKASDLLPYTALICLTTGLAATAVLFFF